jgi:hypothetical protein
MAAAPLRQQRLKDLEGGWAPAASSELPDCDTPVNADVVPRQRRRPRGALQAKQHAGSSTEGMGLHQA